VCRGSVVFLVVTFDCKTPLFHVDNYFSAVRVGKEIDAKLTDLGVTVVHCKPNGEWYASSDHTREAEHYSSDDPV
jgi:hypothetical protein